MAKLAKKTEKPIRPLSDKLFQMVSGPNPEPPPDAEEKEVRVETQPVMTKQPQPLERKPEPAPPPVQTEQTVDQQPRNLGKLVRQMRYQATLLEEKETKELIRRLSDAAGVSLTHSNLMRATRDLLFQVEAKLAAELSRAGLKRPINDRYAIAQYESTLTDIIRTAVRQTPLPFDRGSRE